MGSYGEVVKPIEINAIHSNAAAVPPSLGLYAQSFFAFKCMGRFDGTEARYLSPAEQSLSD